MDENTTTKIECSIQILTPVQIDGKKKDPALIVFIDDEKEQRITILMNKKLHFRTLSRSNQIKEILDKFLTEETLRHLAEMSDREKIAIKTNFEGGDTDEI